jgi:acetyl esterase/lipase
MGQRRALEPGFERLEGRDLPSGAARGLSDAITGLRVRAEVAGVTVQRNIVYTVDDGQAMTLDLYRPSGTPPPGGWPAVVAFPGGGWRWASKSQYGRSVGQLAHFGFVVAVADYTFSTGAPGSHVWPRNLRDAEDAVRWVRRNAARFGINPGTIAAEGVSSGAYLANMLGVAPDEAEAVSPAGAGDAGATSARVQAVVDFYGPVDLAELYATAPRDRRDLVAFLGGTPAQVPARYAAASVSTYVGPGVPPFYIVQGTDDKAVPAPQSNLLAAELKHAGVPYTFEYLVGLGHGFEFTINKNVNVLPDVVMFLRQALNEQPITTATV